MLQSVVSQRVKHDSATEQQRYMMLQAFVLRINVEGGFGVGNKSISYQISKKKKRERCQKGV